MPKVLVPIATGFEEIEAVTIIDLLRRAQIEVVTVCLERRLVLGAHEIQVKTDKHIELINTFPKGLRETILKGYGCNKKSGAGHGNCENGCAGICFKLDDTLVKHKPYFMKWVEAELAN